MTIASTTSKLLYNGDGATTVFPISFVFWQPGDIRVIHRDIGGAETVWTEGTHYTVSGGAGGTGTLAVITAPADHTPAAGEKLLIKSDIAELQQAALPLGGAFPSTTVEQMVDIATRLIQQHSEEIARSVLLPETAALSNLRLPEPGAGEVLRYNAAGTDLETVAFGEISTAIDTLLGGLAHNDLLLWDSGQGAFVNGKTIAGDVTLKRADAGAGSGPLLTLDRASASPQAGDAVGALRLSGRNDAAESVNYAQAVAEIVDTAGGAEDGGLMFHTVAGGAEAARLGIRQGVFAPGALGGDKGVDTVNAAAFHVHGSLLLPRGHIDGLILKNNGASPTTHLDIAPGEAVDGGQAAIMALSSTLTKRIDASWAQGSDQGGLDGTESVAGTPDALTWYHVWLIRRSDTGAVDALFSESATAPVMPASQWDQKRRIGAVGTDASANIAGFTQNSDRFCWNTPLSDYNGAGTTNRTLRTLSVPNGLKVWPILIHHLLFVPDGVARQSIVTDPDLINVAPSTTLFTVQSDGGSSQGNTTLVSIMTNAAGQIGTRESTTICTVKGVNFGWIDPRGKNQ